MKQRVTGDRWQVASVKFCRATRHLPLLLTCHLFLAACGFQPLHSKAYQASLPVDLASVAIEIAGDAEAGDVSQQQTTVSRRYSELLKAEMAANTVSRSAASVPKQFTFLIHLNESQSAQFVNPDGTASRGELTYDSRYTVMRRSDRVMIAQGSIVRTSSYNTAPNADFTSYVSLEDARRRGILELAQAYRLRLAELVPTLADPNAALTDTPANPNKPIPALQPVPAYETLRSRN